VKVRENGRVVSMALVLATAVNELGNREVLGFDVGHREDGAFWTAFLRQLVARGLKGVILVTSDTHQGLKEAIRTVLVGATWQRCRVHFIRSQLAYVPKTAQQMVAAHVRTIFAEPAKASARAQLATVAANLAVRFPKAAELLVEAEEDVLPYLDFPVEHRRQLHSTNPLERLNREIGRRTDEVGIFPNAPALMRLAGAVLQEQNDEWTAATRRYFSQESTSKLYPTESTTPQTLELLTSSPT